MFLVGAVLHDFLGFIFIGNFLAYLGIFYFSITIAVLVYKSNPLKAIKSVKSEPELEKSAGQNKISSSSGAKTKPPKTAPLMLIIILFPLAVHVFMFLILNANDPCNNNPGCMAGSVSGYFFFLLSIPTLVIILIAGLVQKSGVKENFKRYLLINSSIAIFPFVLSFFIYLVAR